MLDQARKSRKNWLEKLGSLFRKIEENDLKMDFVNIPHYDRFDKKILETEFGSKSLKNIVGKLLDDFNTPAMFAQINVFLSRALKSDNIDEKKDFLKVVFWLDENLLKLDLYEDMIFLLNKQDLKQEKTAPQKVKKLADKRWQAKQNENYEKADELREQIQDMGYVVRDKKKGYKLEKISQ